MAQNGKIVFALRSDLGDAQKLSAAAFLASGISAEDPHTVGEAFTDGEGGRYAAAFREPVSILLGGAFDVAAAFHRARAHGDLTIAFYLEDVQSIRQESERHALLAETGPHAIMPEAFAAYGPAHLVDAAMAGLSPSS